MSSVINVIFWDLWLLLRIPKEYWDSDKKIATKAVVLSYLNQLKTVPQCVNMFNIIWRNFQKNGHKLHSYNYFFC